MAPEMTESKDRGYKVTRLTNNESNEILCDRGAGVPAVVALHVDVESLVGGHHRILYSLLLQRETIKFLSLELRN